MNIDTIKKYKNEFDHFVNGGKLLCARARDYKLNWLKATGNHPEFFNTNDEYYIYIIDDEYVELRKALAEGKTIQHISATTGEWVDFNKGFEPTPSYTFLTTPEYYRIKPEEPKFKVGDFVRYVHSTPAKALEINNINGNRYYFTNSEMSCLEYELELWTPVKGEWCWFWDKCTPHRPTLRQYDIFPEGYSEENMFHDSEQNPFDFCEPFLNSRPSYLKDK